MTLADYLACDRFDVRTELERIRLPTLVSRAPRTGSRLSKYAQFLADQIPGARLIEIPGAGHFPSSSSPGR